MLKPSSRPFALPACLAVLCAGVSCVDLAGPGSDLAFVGFAPAFSRDEAAIYQDLSSFQLSVDNVRLLLKHENGELAIDTVVAIVAGQDSVVIELSVRLHESQELLEANLSLRAGDEIVFAGTQDIPAKRGGNVASRPPAIDMIYMGPGALATTLVVGPSDTTIVSTDSVVFRPLALDATGQELPTIPMAWSLSDSTRGMMTSTGVFRPIGGRGETYVIGRLPTGLKDSTLVNYVPKLSQPTGTQP